MGLLEQFTKVAIKAGSIGRKGFGNVFVNTRQDPPSRDTTEWLNAFNESPRLSPVAKMATDIATTRGKVIKTQANGVEKEIKDHDLLKFLYQPNPEFNITGTSSLYLAQVHYLIKGEAFGVIERNLDKTPKFMWFVPPSWVTILSDGKGYEILIPRGSKINVDKKDMFYRKNPNPVNPLGRGIGRVEPLGDEIETDEYMAKFAKRFFFNDAKPNIIITAPDEADDEEIRKAERSWFQKFGGWINSSKAAFLNWDAKVHVLNSTNREMDFVESRRFYRDLVMQHFGIPPEIMGNVENSNKATVIAARDIYRNEVLNPMFIEFEEAITWQLLRQYENSESLRFVFIRKEEDKDEFQLSVLEKAFDGGKITLKEYRNGISKLLRQDLPEIGVEYNDLIFIPANRTPINIKKPLEDQLPKEPEVTDNSGDEGGKDDE